MDLLLQLRQEIGKKFHVLDYAEGKGARQPALQHEREDCAQTGLEPA